MIQSTSISVYRVVAAVLAVALVYGPFSPTLLAQTSGDSRSFEERQCDLDGGVWDGENCEIPEPIDLCANVEGLQESEPCEDTVCEGEGGAWDGAECVMPTPEPEETITEEPTDVCLNVPGNQTDGPCADTECEAGGGTWNGESCDAPSSEETTTTEEQTDVCPNVSGDQMSEPCADTTCEVEGGTWNGDSCDEAVETLALAAASEGEGATDENDPNGSSSSTADSAELDPSESDTDNTDFENITNGAQPPGEDDPRPVVDASATTTEAAATDPVFETAEDNDETGAKRGGTIFTGDANSSTSLKNALNITRSNIDGPGPLNSAIVRSEVDNTATLTTDSETRSNTGENEALGGEGTATIKTGQAVSSAEVINVVNTNLFNSEGLVLFLNPMNGDGFDLRDFDLSYFFNGGAGSSPTEVYGCTILTCLNSSAISILNTNEAEVDNDVYVRAATGENTATSSASGAADIETGDAYAAANVLNMVNTNFINSSYLVLAFNNFGDLNDDIVLPDTAFFEQLFASGSSFPDLNASSFIVNNNNDENFFGTTTANAITGGNIATTTGEGSGNIITGGAYSSSNSYTAANQTRVGGSSVLISFRVWGEWSGSIQGLPEGMDWRANRNDDNTAWLIEIFSTGDGSALEGESYGEFNSSAFMASSTNVATVNTDVNVWAETGDNYTETVDGDGTIRTGDAYAAASVVNMVNTNIVNRNWVFAKFDIFGDWSGDIAFGGHSPDLAVETVVDAPSPLETNDEVDYAFTIENNGDVIATDVVLDAGYNKNLLQYTRGSSGSVSTTGGTRWNVGTLAPGASTTVSATMRVRVPTPQAGFEVPISLSATVSGAARDQDDRDNTSTATITIAGPVQTSTGPTGGGTGSDGGTGSTNPRDDSPRPSGGGNNNTGSGSGNNSESSGNNTGNASSTPPTSNPPPNNTNSNPPPPVVGDATITKESDSSSGGGGAASTERGERVGRPDAKLTKEASISTTTLPALINYKITVKNERYADGPLYRAVLKDTLRGPDGEVITERAWPLDDVLAGDLITLTYSISFAATSSPGTYTNEAVLTGYRGDGGRMRSAPSMEASVDVNLVPGFGFVLGAACTAYLTESLGEGQQNTPSEVTKLQQFLASDPAIYPEGIVSGYYGPLTAAAVTRFQEKYAADILWPLGLSQGTGFAGPSTIAKINELVCGGSQPTSSSTTQSNDATSAPISKYTPPQAPIAPKKVEPDTMPSGVEAIGNLFSKLIPWL